MAAPEIDLTYYFHASPHGNGFAINPPEDIGKGSYRTIDAQHRQKLFDLQRFFNIGAFDMILKQFPPPPVVDEKKIAGEPYAFQISQRARFEFIPLTGKIHLDGIFVPNTLWPASGAFSEYLAHQRKIGGTATVQTPDGHRTRLNFSKRDKLYHRTENGIYVPDTLFQHEEVQLPYSTPFLRTRPVLHPN